MNENADPKRRTESLRPKNPARYGRRNSYSELPSQSIFKPPETMLYYSKEGIATNLDEILTKDSPSPDVFLANQIIEQFAKQKKISDILEAWQEKVRSSSLFTMPIQEENSENDKSDDECSKIPCSTSEFEIDVSKTTKIG